MSEIDVLHAAEHKLAQLAADNARLRKEANYLRTRMPDVQPWRILRRAMADATTILHFRSAGVSTSYRWMREVGMSERQHAWARGLLRAARLGDFEPACIDTLVTAVRRLEAVCERIRKSGDTDLLTLRIHMPRKYAKGYPFQAKSKGGMVRQSVQKPSAPSGQHHAGEGSEG